MLDVLPQLVANDGFRALRAAIRVPERYAIEPKIDGLRGLIVFRPDGVVETRNRRGQVRDWQRHRPFAAGLRRLAQRLPILWDGTVLDAELIAGGSPGRWPRCKDRPVTATRSASTYSTSRYSPGRTCDSCLGTTAASA